MLFKNIKIIDADFTAKDNMFVRTTGTAITYIGETCPEAIEGEEVYDGRGKVMVPGLYNTHCHIPMTILRGYGDGLPLSRWLNEKIFPFEAKLTGDDVYWSTKLGAMECMSSGTMSVSDMYFFIDDMAAALDESGMKANLCHGISSFDPEAKLKEMKGYKDTIALDQLVKSGRFTDGEAEKKAAAALGAEKIASESRIKVDMGLHAEYTTTEPFVRQVAAAAAEENMTVHVHVSETASEHEECKQRHDGRTPVKYFADCGLFENKVQAAHCVYLEEEDMDIMCNAKATALHNPSSNMKLGSGFAPISRFLEKGMHVAIGTDGASSNNNLNMMEEMHMSAMAERGRTRNANAVPTAVTLRMASYEGAVTQGRELCGMIREGWRADFFVIDTMKAHLQPDFDTVSNIVFSAQSSDVVLTMIDGRVVYKNGEFTFVDKEKVIYEANRCFKRILNEL